jgi:hypothetical protein
MRETFPACWPLTANGVKLSMRTTASPISRMDTSVEDGWRESSRTRDAHQHGPARGRNPDAVALDGGVEIAAAAMLLEEGVEVSE